MSALLESLIHLPVELKFGTSGLRGLVSEMTDLECYVNVTGFLDFLAKNYELKQGSVVYLAGDLRDSTPQILKAVNQAIIDAGYVADYVGLVPTPTVAYYAQEKQAPCIMVTGSHIPADRNGIKFYKQTGEVLKQDEAGIFASVAEVRKRIYNQALEQSAFDSNGNLKNIAELPEVNNQATDDYKYRYIDFFEKDALKSKKVIFYQHSSVGRDLLPEIIRALGAEVVEEGRSEVFVPIDTENVTKDDEAYFVSLAQKHPDAFAIISTDGDSDRPFVIDAKGIFYRGDILGSVVADWLNADFCAYPISSSDAVDAQLSRRGVKFEHTKIGSPYVIESMQGALTEGLKTVVGWEVNGGFLLGGDIEKGGRAIKKLPTRDALFPILVALIAAKNSSISELFAALPQRFTQAGLIDDFPQDASAKILSKIGEGNAELIGKYFSSDLGYGTAISVNALDGARIYFSNDVIAHIRPSGNAPQLRIYSVAQTQERADEIVAQAIAEPNGIFRKLEAEL